MSLKPSPVEHIDLTASLPSLQSSLSPDSALFSKCISRLRLREADVHATSMLVMVAGWIVGIIALLSVALILWARADSPREPNGSNTAPAIYTDLERQRAAGGEK